MVCLIAFQLARLTWQVIAPASSPVPLRGSDSPQAKLPQPAVDIDAIVHAHLFGAPAAVATEVPREFSDAPATTLDLTLKGILFAENPADSRAIIAAAKGAHTPYGIGAALPGAAELAAMYSDRVILKRDGRFETLFLSKKPGEPAAPADAGSEPPKYAIDQTGNAEVRRTLAKVRQAFIDRPEQAATLLRVEPARDGDRFLGFRLLSEQNAQLLTQVGLAPGDVVTQVNGVQIDNPVRGLEVLKDLSTAQDISLEVLRNNSPIALRFRVGD
jgi:general secretion pathway protein C